MSWADKLRAATTGADAAANMDGDGWRWKAGTVASPDTPSTPATTLATATPSTCATSTEATAAAGARRFKLYLCRHGQDEDNAAGLLNGHRDTPLTPLGRMQAATVAERVAGEDFGKALDLIFASPLQRAHSTALCICDALNRTQQRGEPLAVRVLPELIERDFGFLTGAPLTDIKKQPAENLLETDKVTYFLRGPGVEEFDALTQRAQRVLQQVEALVAAHTAAISDGDDAPATKTVLMVCHGDIAKAILGVVRGWDWRTALLSPYIANTEVIEL